MMRLWIICAALNGLCAVGAGVWATTGLAELPAAGDLVRMAAQYQMWHALALIGVAWLSDDPGVPHGVIGLAGGCFLLGILLFCGTLYATAAEGVPLFRLSAPAGGLLLIAGWIGLGTAGLMRRCGLLPVSWTPR